FLSKLDATGSALLFSTYLGGSQDEFGQGIAVDSTGSAYLTGMTRSTNFPTVNPLQSRNHGGDEAFVVKVRTVDNAAPLATDDAATTNEDTPITIAVLANDGDPDGDPLTVISVNSPSVPGATAVINGDGTVMYTPATNFVGNDTFTYT